MFGGSSYDDLVTDLDLVGYLEANGKKRVITFDPSDHNDGKNTCNLPATMELPLVVDNTGNALPNTFLTDSVINPYIANLEKRKQEGEKYNVLVSELKEAIELITDDISANEFVLSIDEYQHIGSSKMMAGKMLNEKVKSLGLTLNKQSKKYEKV